ncbi:MAG TPA: hypothetical protein VNX61_10670 [Rhizomicrobium sp.]|jgi:hypothetical protein|nr:hypothetical protein [Rhizomicrobium sp.]
MSRILTITLSALILAGCASEPGYDKSAMPNATAAMRQETAMCEKEQTPTKFTASKFMACRVAAERNLAMAIHLPKMDAFNTYAAKMLALAADYDAGRINLKRMGPAPLLFATITGGLATAGSEASGDTTITHSYLPQT